MPAKKQESKAAKDKMAKAVQEAIAGNLDWLDDVIRDAGYINPSLGLQQKVITDENITSRKILGEWENAGLDSKKHDRRKYYPLYPFIRFLFNRKTSSTTEENSELRKWQAMDKKASALDRKRKLDLAMGKLIDREEADQKFIELIMHVIAGLETTFGGIAPQLVNKSVTEIRKLLEKRIDWLCREMQNERTPVPSKKAGNEIKRIIREENETTG